MYIPKPDQMLVVDLPGERMPCRVCRVLGDNHVIVEIVSEPLTRHHFYRKGDLAACRRTFSVLGEAWTAAEERRGVPISFEEEAAAETHRPTRTPKPKPKQKAAKKPKPKVAAKKGAVHGRARRKA